jgi:hypothetical protein
MVRNMRYMEFRDAIDKKLRRARAGLTWAQLKAQLDLPYARPCPEWTKQLERDIGLKRVPGPQRAHVWTPNHK